MERPIERSRQQEQATQGQNQMTEKESPSSAVGFASCNSRKEEGAVSERAAPCLDLVVRGGSFALKWPPLSRLGPLPPLSPELLRSIMAVARGLRHPHVPKGLAARMAALCGDTWREESESSRPTTYTATHTLLSIVRRSHALVRLARVGWS